MTPSTLDQKSISSASCGVAEMIAPATTSLWPLMYFVVEWMTTSAPSSRGRCRSGVRNVLSTTTRAPTSCAAALIAARSVTRSSGFDGVSSHTSFGRSSRIAACAAAVSVKSVVAVSKCFFCASDSKSRQLPP